MKIAVNTRLLLQNKLEGIGWFTFESLSRITKAHPEHQFYFIFDRKYSDEFLFSPNITPVVLGPQARHPVLYYLWFEYSIPAFLKKLNPALFFSPDGYLSLSTRVKSMNVIHDLGFEHYPDHLPYIEKKYYTHYFPKYAARAARIATVSEYSKSDISSLYGIPSGNIDVVCNGANEKFRPLCPDIRQKVKQRFTGGAPYFIYVGSLHPRKNIINLLKAFDLFRERGKEKVKLLIVGEKMWGDNMIETVYEKMKNKNEVVFTGRLSIDDLTLAMGSALALTYVSFFEGFGIPIVEAFYAEVPVITSNVSSMPEVAGNAALLSDPFSPESICGNMLKMSTDEGLRNSLILKGKERRKNYSWDKTAEKLWNSIQKAISQ
ncbi:MAG: glycosyltransferase family 4 protein [Bacteroidales bacterium]|nr:glycosyltransferase family 4 protein [Bacteroidales bacterium]